MEVNWEGEVTECSSRTSLLCHYLRPILLFCYSFLFCICLWADRGARKEKKANQILQSKGLFDESYLVLRSGAVLMVWKITGYRSVAFTCSRAPSSLRQWLICCDCSAFLTAMTAAKLLSRAACGDGNSHPQRQWMQPGSPCRENMKQPENGNNYVCDLSKLTPSKGCRAGWSLPALTNGVLLSVPWMWREDM